MLKKLAAWTVVVALLVAVLFLLSERNRRTYSVEQRGQELHILRGRMLPAGFEEYVPADKSLAQAYAPLALGAGDSPGDLVLSTYADRDELDRALFGALRTWIDTRVESDDPNRLAQAMGLLRRAELLNGIEDEQRRQLRDLQGRIAWFEGRARLDEAVGTLRDAVNKLKLAADGRSRFARDAGELYERVHALSEQLGHAVRMPLVAGQAEPAQGAGGVPAEGGGEQAAVVGESAPGPAPQAAPVAVPQP